MSTELSALNSFAYDPAFAALFADWRLRLQDKNTGSDAEFWLELVPFAAAWQGRTIAMFRLARPSGKTYAGALQSFLENALPGVDKTDFTAVLWLAKDNHVAIARDHIRSLNWAGDVRKLNSPRAIRNAVQKVMNEKADREEREAENARRRENGEATVEVEAEDAYDASIQAMLDRDELAAEDRPEAGVVGAYLKSLKYHNTLSKRIIAVKGDTWMRDMCMNALLDIHEAEMKARVEAGKKPLSMGAWFKANKFEI